MTTLYFKVANGIQTGNVIIDGNSGNVTGLGNAELGNLATANFFSGNGSLLTGLNASNLASGTIPSGILGNSTVYIGTTGVALNRSSGSQSLTGVNIDGNANYATYSGTATTAVTVTGNSQPNITSVGTLSSLDVTGNITAGNVSGGNLVSANYISGTLTTAAQPNITSVGTLSSLDVTGNVSTSGNLVATTAIWAPTIYGNVVGNISGTIQVPGSDKWVLYNTNGNAGSSTNFQFDYNTNVLTVVGNITSSNANLGNLVTGNYFSGSGNLLSNIQGANVSGTVGSATTAGTVTTNAQPNITSVGTLSSLTVTGNITSGNATLGNLASASYFSGDGGLLSNIAGGNVTGTVGSATTAGTVTTAAQPNITSVGTMQSITMAGGTSISGGNLVSANYLTGTLTTQAQPNITSLGTLTALGVNGNLNITGNINVTGNLNYSNVSDLVVGDPLIYLGANNTGNIWDLGIVGSYNDGSYYHTGIARNAADGTWTVFDRVVAEPTTVIDWANATIGTFKVGNLTAGNIAGANLVAANYVSGNGSLLTSITGGNVTGQVANALVAGTVYSNAQPNITSVGTLSSLSVTGLTTATGGLKTANIQDTGGTNTISVSSATVGITGNLTVGTGGTGNVNATYFVGDGSTLTNITGGNVTGQVGNALVAGTVYTNAQPNITSVGTLNGVTVTGTADLTGASNVSLGPVGNVHISGGTNGYLLQTNGSGTLSWVAPPSTSSLVNGTSNVSIPSSGGNVNTSVGGTSNVLVVTSTGVNVAGYMNATGNITSGNAALGNLASASYFSGDGGLLSNIAGGNVTGQVANALIAGTVYSNAQPNITSLGTLTSLTVSGNLTTGNLVTSGSGGNISGVNYITANYFSGNGSSLSGLNASNLVSGTISSGILGNSTLYIGTTSIALNRSSGSQSLTGITSIDGYASTVSTNAQPNITSVGTLTSLAVTGNATVGNVVLNGGIQSNRANVSVSTNTVIDEFAPSTYRTAKYVISASSANGYQSAEIILVHNGSSSYISIYGSVCSNATADIVDFSSNINGVSGNVSVYATGSSVTLNLVATYLKT